MAEKRMYQCGSKVYYLTEEQAEFGNVLLAQFGSAVRYAELKPVEIYGFTKEKEEG